MKRLIVSVAVLAAVVSSAEDIRGLIRPAPKNDLSRDPAWQARFRTFQSSADGTKQPFYWYDPAREEAVPLLVALHTWSASCNWNSPATAKSG